jgi:hypothetical protein
LQNNSLIPQGRSTEFPKNGDPMILLTAEGIAVSLSKKNYFYPTAMRIAKQCASLIARPEASASNVTDDTVLSSGPSQNYCTQSQSSKQRIETPAKLRLVFLPI